MRKEFTELGEDLTHARTPEQANITRRLRLGYGTMTDREQRTMPGYPGTRISSSATPQDARGTNLRIKIP